MNRNKLVEGAYKIINTCLKVRRGENVVVLADMPNLNVGLVLAQVAREAGAEVSLLLMDTRKAHAQNPPKPIAKAMLQADAAVLATVFSLSNSKARQQANRCRARIISIPDCQADTLIDGAIEADFEAMRPIVERIGRLLSQGQKLHISSELGTNVTVRLCGYPSLDQTSMAHEPGSWAPAPHVEAAVGPDPDGVDGLLIVDGVVVPGGVPKEPIKVVLQRGKVVAVEGGKDAVKLRTLMENFNDPNIYQVVEVGIGLNPKAQMGRGRMIEDEGQFGTLHLGLGEGGTFGLPVSAASHLDLVIRRPKVIIDGKKIVADEKLSTDLDY